MRKLISAIVIALSVIIGGAGAASAADPDYTVQRGDTLSEIRPDTWRYVCVVNVAEGRVPHCDLIVTGQQIRTKVSAAERAGIDRWFAALPRSSSRSEQPRQATSGDTAVPDAPAAPAPAPAPRSSGGWAIPEYIVMCESGGDYGAENPTSTASGAYQILDSTWDGYGGYSHASDAPPSVQDERAAQIWNGGAGRDQWVC
jgi:Transglycosylase-like domain